MKAVEPRIHFSGVPVMSVVIENDFNDTPYDRTPPRDPDHLTAEQICEIVKNAGIVGMGGATFPTHVKISSGLGKVDTVIVNASEPTSPATTASSWSTRTTSSAA